MPIAKFRLRPNHTALLLAALLSWPALALASPPLQPGQALPELTLKDQHDQAWKVSADTKLVLFAAGRKASNLVQTVLADQAGRVFGHAPGRLPGRPEPHARLCDPHLCLARAA